MCSTDNKACFPPIPHFPNWSYHCPAKALDGTDESHRFEMDWNTEHGIILCPDHRDNPQPHLKLPLSMQRMVDSPMSFSRYPNTPQPSGNRTPTKGTDSRKGNV